MKWVSFSGDQIAAISELARESGGSAPRCPVCGGSIRRYLYESQRGSRRTLVSYVWSPECRHFAGSLGPYPEGLKLSDPLGGLDQKGREAIERNVAKMFAVLDALWEEGKLPQVLTR